MGEKRNFGVTIGDTHFPCWKDAAAHYKLAISTLKYRIRQDLPLDAPLHVTRTSCDTRRPYLFQKLPEVVQEWVLGSMPKNSTVTEFITAIVIDAYYDEGEPYGPILDTTSAEE